MKDSLEEFVGKNREAFDDREPSGKIWNHIASSLSEGRQRSLWNSVAVWRAAALALVGLSVYLFMTHTSPGIPSKETSQAQIEFKDLEIFYSRQIEEKVALIRDFDGANESDQFTQDFEKLDAMYQVLLEEMKTHPGGKVKDALILNLLVRIDLLNQQLKKLEDSKKPAQKTPSATV